MRAGPYRQFGVSRGRRTGIPSAVAPRRGICGNVEKIIRSWRKADLMVKSSNVSFRPARDVWLSRAEARPTCGWGLKAYGSVHAPI
mgnify:CR=1 FL=1